MIRLGQAYQESLLELLPPRERKEEIFKTLKLSVRQTKQIAIETRRCLGIPLTMQFKFGSAESAFKVWRHALEQAGFSLHHDRFPIVFVNNSNSHTRQLFTLFHELAHILFGVSGITDIDETYVQFLNPSQRLMEIECNEYAAEVLVPEEAFRSELARFRERNAEIVIRDLAEKYSVSREVILRRFLDYGEVTPEYYQTKVAHWKKDYLRASIKAGGGNYYLTRLAYLGEGFARLAFRSHYAGKLSKPELANHLNMNARNVDRLEGYRGS